MSKDAVLCSRHISVWRARPVIRAMITLLALLASVAPGLAQSPSGDATQLPSTASRVALHGFVLDAETEQPLHLAHVVVVSSGFGVVSGPDGAFEIPSLPSGEVAIRATFVGYEPATETVSIIPGATAEVTIRLKPTVAVELDGLEIRADRPMIDVQKGSSGHLISARELEGAITESPSLASVVAQQAGIVEDRGQLHFRGGRADEVLFIVDGIKMVDPLSGEALVGDVASRSLREVSMTAGGFGAAYSEAMSGVVEAVYKEGSGEWHGSLDYTTDALFGSEQIHRANIDLSGPNVLLRPLLGLFTDDPKVTIYGSLGMSLEDGYLPTVHDLPGDRGLVSAVHDKIAGFDFRYGDFFYPLGGRNNWNALVKSIWAIGPDDKLGFTASKSLTFSQDVGYADIGQIDRGSIDFPWNWAKRWDHHYTDTKDVNVASISWERTLGSHSNMDLRLARLYSGDHKDVGGKLWDEYDTTVEEDLQDMPGFIDTPYFYDAGDAREWRDRYSIVWSAAAQTRFPLGAHRLDCGLSAEYHDIQYIAIDARAVDTAAGYPYGKEFDFFHVNPTAGNLFVQDQVAYEGMVVNGGLAYDCWFPGEQVQRALDEQTLPYFTPSLRDKFYAETHSLFGYRFKGHLSPRLAISFPASERAHLFFNYGHYSQRPRHFFMYAQMRNLPSDVYPRIGNPTLNPEIAVNYEIGGEYVVGPTELRATVFWKDNYDYPTTITLTRLREHEFGRSNYFIYWNADYSRSRGIELSIERLRRRFFSWSLDYTYSVAKGKSSDPNALKLIQELGGDAREPLLEEQYVWWNRPHKLSAQVGFQVREHEAAPRWLGVSWPGDLSVRVSCLAQSGRAYTPIGEDFERSGDTNSRNAPFEIYTNLSVRKGIRFGGRRVELSLDVLNLFDRRNVQVVDPMTNEAPQPGVGSYSDYDPAQYDTVLEREIENAVGDQTREYRRQYGQDPDAALVAAWEADVTERVSSAFTSNYFSLQNPGYYGPPRSIRAGISYEW